MRVMLILLLLIVVVFGNRDSGTKEFGEAKAITCDDLGGTMNNFGMCTVELFKLFENNTTKDK